MVYAAAAGPIADLKGGNTWKELESRAVGSESSDDPA